MSINRPRLLWRPQLAILRRNVLASERGNELAKHLSNLGIPFQVSDEPWELFAQRLEIYTESVARRVLLVELEPIRDIRPEGFPNIKNRPEFFFGTQGVNCPYRCEYCYLFANTKGIVPLVLFTNLNGLFNQITDTVERYKQHLTFNFGEDTDSLATEHLLSNAKELIEFFAGFSASLELRTKSGVVRSLLDLQHKRKTTIGISVNPPEIVDKYEHLTASVEERLAAGRDYVEAGYSVALHLEPGILDHGWEAPYIKFIRSLPDWFTESSPSYMSLGCFRYRPELNEAIKRNYPRNNLVDAASQEYVPNRFSYPHRLRRSFYVTMIRELHEFWPDLPIYLSMESIEMCEELGANPWLELARQAEFVVTTAAERLTVQ